MDTIIVGVDNDTPPLVKRTQGVDVIRQTVAVVIFQALHAI